MDARPYPISGTTRDAIGKKLGMSGRTYERARYIRDNAPQEVIARLDAGESSIYREYNELRALEKAEDAVDKRTIADGSGAAMVEDAALAGSYESGIGSKEVSESGCNPAVEHDDDVNAGDDEVTIEQPGTNNSDDLNPSPFYVPRPLSKEDEEASRRIAEFNRLPLEEKIKALDEELYQTRGRAAKAESELIRVKDQLHNTTLHGESKIESLKRQLAEASARFTELHKQFEEVQTAKSTKTQSRNVCRWERQEEDGSLFKCDNDKCGFEWNIEGDNPHEFGIRFCPGCGREIC